MSLGSVFKTFTIASGINEGINRTRHRIFRFKKNN